MANGFWAEKGKQIIAPAGSRDFPHLLQAVRSPFRPRGVDNRLAPSFSWVVANFLDRHFKSTPVTKPVSLGQSAGYDLYLTILHARAAYKRFSILANRSVMGAKRSLALTLDLARVNSPVQHDSTDSSFN